MDKQTVELYIKEMIAIAIDKINEFNSSNKAHKNVAIVMNDNARKKVVVHLHESQKDKAEKYIIDTFNKVQQNPIVDFIVGIFYDKSGIDFLCLYEMNGSLFKLEKVKTVEQNDNSNSF